MKTVSTDKGFTVILHEKYASELGEYERLVQESSAAGGPFLWIGKNHHLNREEIEELIARLQYWLDNKRLNFD
ncbi:hypothetical protein KA005_33420 [bacterium]|nr:hypothetical protein [bacterium]